MNLYEEVTNRILVELDKGVVPWRKPWKDTIAGSDGRPRNAGTMRPYRGINSLLLSLMPYEQPLWLTFKQAKDLGGSVREGEKGVRIVFFKMHDVTDEDGEARQVPLLRAYSVFNVEQCDDLNLAVHEVDPLPSDERCEALIYAYPDPPRLLHQGERACYVPAWDEVHMPIRDAFRSVDDYYATLFHELAHATGHEKRLNRAGWDAFASSLYCREELVAELASCFMARACGIDPLYENSAAYINSWIEALSGNSKLLVQAAGQAQKAADWSIDALQNGTMEETLTRPEGRIA